MRGMGYPDMMLVRILESLYMKDLSPPLAPVEISMLAQSYNYGTINKPPFC